MIQPPSPLAPGLSAEDVVPDPATAYPYLLLYESRQRRYLTPPLEPMPHGKDRFLAYPCAVGQRPSPPEGTTGRWA